MNAPVEKIGFLIHDAQRLLRRRFDASAAQYGLSSSQWRLMVRVVKEKGIAQARLAEILEIEPISVSRLVDRMEEGGWVQRQADETDRRVRIVVPTDRSRAVFNEVKQVAGEVFEDALRGLSMEQRHALLHGLETMISNLASVGDAPAETSECKESAA